MQQSEYAYAVSRIRANEVSLLTKADIDSLISADSTNTAVRILTDKGWKEPENSDSFDICENEMAKAWDLLRESVPDSELFKALVISNDFANLKAAIKATFSDAEAENYMTCPYLCEPEIIIKSVKQGEFKDLPDYLSSVAHEAYFSYIDNQSGQLTEMIIDKACNRAKLGLAKSAQSRLLVEIIENQLAVSDIKTARRCASTGKTKEFAAEALSGAGKINAEALIDAAFAGSELKPIIAEAGLAEIAEYADSDFTALEMMCDNLITEKIRKTKYEIFGPDPVVAYYYAKVAEVKNVRIILSAKASSVPSEVISERVREIYA